MSDGIGLQSIWAFVTTALPVLRVLPFVAASQPEVARSFRRPHEDIADGKNPYRVWLEGRDLDARTVARRMDMTEDAFIKQFLWGWGQDKVVRTARDISAFCQAVDITPCDLVPTNDRTPLPEFVQAAVYYNCNYMSFGHERVTRWLEGVCYQADKEPLHGTGLSNPDMMNLINQVCINAGVSRNMGPKDSVASAHAGLCDKIENLIEHVRGKASVDGGKLPFAIDIDYDGTTARPSFGRDAKGKVVLKFLPSAKNMTYRQEASIAFLKALHAWYIKPETKVFLQQVAAREYIVGKRYGVCSQSFVPSKFAA